MKGVNLKIRGKLMLAFMAMISLTLVVSSIAFFSQQFAQKTVDKVVQVHGKIERLSLETDKGLSLMANYEKDFFLNYRQVGIQEAKDLYLNKLIAEGGKTYKTLYAIQQLAVNDADRASAQSAMEAINEYLSALLGTVSILELRVDTEFGELIKLEQSGEALNLILAGVNDKSLQDRNLGLQTAMQRYILLPDAQAGTEVRSHFDAMGQGISQAPVDESLRRQLSGATAEYSRWFAEVSKTDGTIASRVAAYTAAAEEARPVLAAFVANAAENEIQAIAAMERQAQTTRYLLLAIGLTAVVLGGLIAVGLSRGMTRQVGQIMDLLSDIGMGNFDARVEVVSTDELGTMAFTLNAMLDNITLLIQSQDERDKIQDSIMKLLEEISDLTEGDLTARAEVTEDMTGAIADSFNTMANQFGDIIRQVKATTASVDDTSLYVNNRTVELADKSSEQSRVVNGAVASINTMVQSIQQVSQNASQSAEVSSVSRTHARQGALAVSETNQAIEEIREQINETARSIKRLGESSLEIGNVIQIINDIADRTSILALNASIQAAMAGDAGHGFAVVAEEVQRLAESSSDSTKQIEILVKSIQAEIKGAGNRMDESIAKVVKGTRLADNAHEKLQEIEQVSNQLADLIESIRQASLQQVKVSADISNSMKEVGAVSEETSVASKETAESMNVLSQTARTLTEAVAMFKIETVSPPAV
ncbi:methyl-accepting chemotaxis protein [Desulfogranum mediterraneum]|uniref:methyl-accepting chemotaxis protein n=1 Tax=Desulfogranum mediterraneum TaxID=160661 RepID=UPI000413C0F1|nr:HAMP domain-containing methyl-accepting chemotaxis protein [Desulfogranum mediterraneum]